MFGTDVFNSLAFVDFIIAERSAGFFGHRYLCANVLLLFLTILHICFLFYMYFLNLYTHLSTKVYIRIYPPIFIPHYIIVPSYSLVILILILA